MIADRPIIGILFMMGFCMLAPMGDAAAKSISLVTPMMMMLLARYAVQFILPIPIIIASRRRIGMSWRILRIILARSVVHIAGVGTMYVSLRHLPLADALAIAFVYPFIMLVMGHMFLGEQVGVRRIAACTIGFAGTLMIIQPSFAAVGWPALLPLAVAFLFASLVLLTRQIAKDYDPICLQAASGFTSTLILLLCWLLFRDFGVADMQISSVTPRQAVGLTLIGLFGTLSHLSMNYAVRFAPSATLAPMQYIELPVAVSAGWLIFGELPNSLAALGITISVASGLAVIYFEHRALTRQHEARQA
ncbi:MAG: DMT family transporter [Candidatus Puniceispirillaceae bacterium]